MKNKLILIVIILFFSLILNGCQNSESGQVNLVVNNIENGISYEGVPYYMGDIKNIGDKTANYTVIEIEVFANEDKVSHAAINSDYVGKIKPGELNDFTVYFWGIHTLTDISNYKVNFEYE